MLNELIGDMDEILKLVETLGIEYPFSGSESEFDGITHSEAATLNNLIDITKTVRQKYYSNED